MKDLGELHYCLGLEVWRQSGKTMITQSKYVKDILKRLRMENCKPVVTPTLYKKLVGTLMCLKATSPDIMFVVSLISWSMDSPKNTHYFPCWWIEWNTSRGTALHSEYWTVNSEQWLGRILFSGISLLALLNYSGGKNRLLMRNGFLDLRFKTISKS